MAAPKEPGELRPAIDSEVDLAGYDPYIVALTSVGTTDAGTSATKLQATESRKVKLITWLRERRA